MKTAIIIFLILLIPAFSFGGDKKTGVSGIQATVDKAKAWIAGRPEIFSWPSMSIPCCDVAGDANNSGEVNILDITFLISHLYKNGSAPPCWPEGDSNGDQTINILDITYLIAFLYKAGPPPICV